MLNVHAMLDDYAGDHLHPVNRGIHRVCVPLISVALIGLLWSVPVPWSFGGSIGAVNWATVFMPGVAIFYLALSVRLAVGMVLFMAAAVAVVALLEGLPLPLWQVCGAVFVLAWAGQFFGHAAEGRQPSFLRNPAHLLVGPLFLLAQLYRQLGIRY